QQYILEFLMVVKGTVPNQTSLFVPGHDGLVSCLTQVKCFKAVPCHKYSWGSFLPGRIVRTTVLGGTHHPSYRLFSQIREVEKKINAAHIIYFSPPAYLFPTAYFPCSFGNNCRFP